MNSPVVRPFGDRAILVEFEDELSSETNGLARAVARHMRGLPGVLETIPALRSALVVIDPLRADRAALAAAAADLARSLPVDRSDTGRTIEIPVVYGGDSGPDLDDVAAALKLRPDEVIALHTGTAYTVYMLGFAAGFAYLGMLDARLRVPRLATPRVRVPAGSVAIADGLTGIYPLQSPGGWRLIGRTPLPVYDPREPDPIVFRPGDRVQFVRVRHAEFPADRPIAPLADPSHPALEVLEPGLFTTVQDLGRSGYRHLGMPAAGAMDPDSLRMANLAAGNAPGVPCIECTAPGPVLRALDDLVVVVTGADLTAVLDSAEIDMWEPVKVRAGQVIRFGAPRRGMWAYVAAAGGVEAREILGSGSAFVAGGIGRRFQSGDFIGVRPLQGAPPQVTVPEDAIRIPPDKAIVRVVSGPQEQWFTEEAIRGFHEATFRITVHTDRGGSRLHGPPIPRQAREMLSDAMLPGAIQIPPDGQPIVIMADGPTTGGYPKIGVVASVDVPLLAQARPGTRVRFEATTLERAVDALRARVAFFEELQGIRGLGD